MSTVCKCCCSCFSDHCKQAWVVPTARVQDMSAARPITHEPLASKSALWSWFGALACYYLLLFVITGAARVHFADNSTFPLCPVCFLCSCGTGLVTVRDALRSPVTPAGRHRESKGNSGEDQFMAGMYGSLLRAFKSRENTEMQLATQPAGAKKTSSSPPSTTTRSDAP